MFVLEIFKVREMFFIELQDRVFLFGFQVFVVFIKVLFCVLFWEGVLDMFFIKWFWVRVQLVLGYSCWFIQVLFIVICLVGCIFFNIVWDFLVSICLVKVKDVCVIRLCLYGVWDIQNCCLFYLYFNDRQCYGLVFVEYVGMVLLFLFVFQFLFIRLYFLGGLGLEVIYLSLLLVVLFFKEGFLDIVGFSFWLGKI